jgi:hypothetical protein
MGADYSRSAQRKTRPRRYDKQDEFFRKRLVISERGPGSRRFRWRGPPIQTTALPSAARRNVGTQPTPVTAELRDGAVRRNEKRKHIKSMPALHPNQVRFLSRNFADGFTRGVPKSCLDPSKPGQVLAVIGLPLAFLT